MLPDACKMRVWLLLVSKCMCACVGVHDGCMTQVHGVSLWTMEESKINLIRS